MARDEIFGPIAAVLRVPDYDAALDAANDSDFGLSAGIVSPDPAKTEHFSQNAEAGMIQVNCPPRVWIFTRPLRAEKDHPMVRRKKAAIAASSLQWPRLYMRGVDDDASTAEGFSHT